MTTQYRITDKGEETIEGLLCEKEELSMGDVVVQTAWISKKYRFPIKLTNHDKGKQYYMMELRNIKESKISPRIFEVPKDFQLMK